MVCYLKLYSWLFALILWTRANKTFRYIHSSVVGVNGVKSCRFSWFSYVEWHCSDKQDRAFEIFLLRMVLKFYSRACNIRMRDNFISSAIFEENVEVLS